MTKRERYYHLDHEFRFMRWQIEQAQEFNRQRAIRRRLLREAHMRVKLGIPQVIAANVAYYNRAIQRG